LTGGGWEEGTGRDKGMVANSEKIQSNQKLLDEVDVGNPSSESSHAVTVKGETFQDTQELPDGMNLKKMIKDDGRGFKHYIQFTAHTEPGFKHRLWLRVDSGRNLKGMALAAWNGTKWIQVGVRTQNIAGTRHFDALCFDIPESRITSGQTYLRLASKYGDEINLYHAWLYKIESSQAPSITEILGFAPNQNVGEVSHGVLPKGKQWRAPILLAQHPEQCGVIMMKVGKGYLIRSELSLEDSIPMLKNLLKDQTLEQLSSAWPGS
jgi:hypothetical protein